MHYMREYCTAFFEEEQSKASYTPSYPGIRGLTDPTVLMQSYHFAHMFLGGHIPRTNKRYGHALCDAWLLLILCPLILV
jgi:hypothetical protein